MNPVKWHVAARLELFDALDFYEQESPGLGSDFLREVDLALQALGVNPALGPKVLREYRRKVVRRFPYSIIYRFEEGLYVLALAHQKRRPRYWVNRG